MFLELNAKHGNERPKNLQDLRINSYFVQKGGIKVIVDKNRGQNNIMEIESQIVKS